MNYDQEQAEEDEAQQIELQIQPIPLSLDIISMASSSPINDNLSSSISSRPRSNLLKRRYSDWQRELKNHIKQDISNALVFQKLSYYIEERVDTRDTRLAYKFRHIYHTLQMPRQISCVTLLLMSFFQKPCWCLQSKYTEDCTQIVNTDTIIYVSGVPYLNTNIFYSIEILLILFLLLNKMFKYSYLTNFSKRKYKLYGLFITGGGIIISNIFGLIIPNDHYCIDMFLIPIYFLIYNRLMRSTFMHYMRILNRGKSIFGLMAFNIVLFAGIGKSLFETFDVADNPFRDMLTACYALFVLQTTSNFPDVMMPFYQKNKFSFLYFMAFLMINTLILVNMVLAVFYSCYKKEVQTHTLRLFKHNQPSYIQQKQSVLIKLEEQKEEMSPRARRKPKNAETALSVFLKQTKCIRKYHHYHQGQRFLLQVLQSTKFEIFMEILNTFNFFLVFFNSYEILPITLFVFDFLCNLAFITEELLNIYVVTWHKYKIQFFNLFQLALSTIIIILLTIYSITLQVKILRIMQYLILLRVLRMLKLILRTQNIQFFFIAFYQFIPFFVDLLGVLVMFFYFFTALGIFVQFYPLQLNRSLDFRGQYKQLNFE